MQAKWIKLDLISPEEVYKLAALVTKSYSIRFPLNFQSRQFMTAQGYRVNYLVDVYST